MYDQGGLAHNSVAFAFEHQIAASEQQELEFGAFLVIWYVRYRGMKDPTISLPVSEHVGLPKRQGPTDPQVWIPELKP
jgi:hypothetical protein